MCYYGETNEFVFGVKTSEAIPWLPARNNTCVYASKQNSERERWERVGERENRILAH